MTSSNCLINENIYQCKSNYPPKNFVKKEFLKEKNDYFYIYGEFQKTQNLSLIKTVICNGRNLAEAYLKYYFSSSETCCLYRILEIHNSLFEFYSYSLVANEPYFIRDKCKYYTTHILVLFLINRISVAKNKIEEYKRHCVTFKRDLNPEFYDYYMKMYYLYRSLTHVSIIDNNQLSLDVDYRLGCQPYELDLFSKQGKRFYLQRAIIIGACSSQPFYRYYTIDMLRMCVAVEYQPNEIPTSNDPTNCRKWTFYNKSIFDISIGINDATCNISKRGIFLLYASADEFELKTNGENPPEFLSRVGLKMKQFGDVKIKQPNEECMLPIDVLSFLVTPTVIIIDSSSSHEFFSIKDHAKIPLLCLLSPISLPNYIAQEEKISGKLFTMFLTCPLKAFCFICYKKKIDAQIMTELNGVLKIFMMSVEAELKMNVDDTLRLFMEDPVCRALFLRYLFCNISLRLHEDFPKDKFLPKCNLVEVENSIVNNDKFHKLIYSMADILNSLEKFPIASDLSHTELSIDVVH